MGLDISHRDNVNEMTNPVFWGKMDTLFFSQNVEFDISLDYLLEKTFSVEKDKKLSFAIG